LAGDTGASNTDPDAKGPKPDNHWVQTGSHVMVVGAGARAMEGYPRTADPDPTKPYVMWPGTPYEHLMVPVRQIPRPAPLVSCHCRPRSARRAYRWTGARSPLGSMSPRKSKVPRPSVPEGTRTVVWAASRARIYKDG